jgi:hypothetical protein
VGVSDHKLNFLKGLLTIKVQYYHPRKDLMEYSGESPGEQPQTGNMLKCFLSGEE